jgi:hypothetical protein
MLALAQWWTHPHGGGQHFWCRGHWLSFVQHRGSCTHSSCAVSGEQTSAQRIALRGQRPAESHRIMYYHGIKKENLPWMQADCVR